MKQSCNADVRKVKDWLRDEEPREGGGRHQVEALRVAGGRDLPG